MNTTLNKIREHKPCADLRAAAEMALEALLTCDVDYDYDENPYDTFDAEDVFEAIEALRQALAPPEQEPEQEPVAWMLPDYGDVLSASEADGTGIYNIPLYTAPPSKPWVSLTDDEINDIRQRNTINFTEQARLIENKLRKKNG